LIHEPKPFLSIFSEAYILTCVRYILIWSRGKLKGLLYTQNSCLYSDLFISILLCADLRLLYLDLFISLLLCADLRLLYLDLLACILRINCLVKIY
jgi:hypothetical protein